mgnify:CR=1 FL=1
MQYNLLKIGILLGFDVTPASNDKSKSFGSQSFSFTKLPELPTDKDTQNTIKLIDVLWFQKGTDKIIGAFEVEKSTSIYSGILRLSDLYFSISNGEEVFYIIIPDSREKDVIQQLNRPVIKNSKMNIKYILFSELRTNCDAICKFGSDHSIMEKIAKSI